MQDVAVQADPPKEQQRIGAWIRETVRWESLNHAYEQALAAGRTRARSVHGWVSEWAPEAALVLAGGGEFSLDALREGRQPVAHGVGFERLELSLSPEQKQALREAARRDGQSLQTWATERLAEAAASVAPSDLLGKDDPELRAALLDLSRRYPAGSPIAIVRMALVTLRRQIQAGHDPFELTQPSVENAQVETKKTPPAQRPRRKT